MALHKGLQKVLMKWRWCCWMMSMIHVCRNCSLYTLRYSMELQWPWRLRGRLKNWQMRDETNECLSVSVKKMNKDAKTMKHGCYSEGAITWVEAMQWNRASVAHKPPAKRKSKIMNFKEQKSLLKFLDPEMTQYFLQLWKPMIWSNSYSRINWGSYLKLFALTISC